MNRVLLLILFFSFSWALADAQPCGNPEPCSECGEDNGECILCDIVDLDGYCYTLPSENDEETLVGCGMAVFNNDRWFGLIATGNYLEMEIIPTNCQGSGTMGNIGIQAGMYGACVSDIIDVQCDCRNTQFTLEGPTTPGQTYWIGIDGCAGDICDIEINVIQGAGNFALNDPQTINGVGPSDDPIEICWGYQGYSFVAENVFGAQQYEWLLPDGQVVIQDGPNSPPVNFPDQGLFEVCVRALHDCDTSDQVCVDIEVIPLPPDSIYQQICESDPCVPFDDGGCYNTSGFYSASLQDANGCFFDRVLELLVVPENDTFLLEVVCEDDLPFILPDGMPVNEPGPYNSVIQNGFGCDSFIQSDLSILSGEISISEVECDDGLFTINAVLDRSPYVTDFTAEWKDEDGNVVSDSLDLVVSEGGLYTLCTTISADDFDDGFTVTCVLDDFEFELNDSTLLPQTTDSLSGLFVFCEPDTVWYSTDSLGSIDSYIWDVPSGAVILEGDGTHRIQLDLSNAVTGDVCVSLENECGVGDPYCREIFIIDDIQAMAGPDTGVCGNTYEMRAILQGNGGLWQLVDGPGKACYSDSSAADALVEIDSFGVYTFSWTDSAGICRDMDTVQIEFWDLPQSADTITYDCGGASDTYTISFRLSGGLAPYSVLQGGGSISAGVYTSDQIPSDSSFSVSIIDSRSCGPLELMGNHSCPCLSSVGNMSSDTANACVGNQLSGAYDDADEFLDSNDTCLFVLHAGSVDSIGVPLMISAEPLFSYLGDVITPSDSTFYITKVVGNFSSGFIDLDDRCTAISNGQPAVWRDFPQAQAGIDQDVCLDTTEMAAILQRGEGFWSQLSGPGAVVIGNPTDPSSVLTLDTFGVYEMEWIVSSYDCESRDTVRIEYHGSPQLASTPTFVCNAANEGYQVELNLVGGDAMSYQFDGVGGDLSGTEFVSDVITSGEEFIVRFWDDFGCDTLLVRDSFSCPCISTPGSMAIDTLFLCEDEEAQAVYDPMDEVFDANDALIFVLHDLPGDSLGTVVQMNSNPQFVFDGSQMNYDQVYYISPIVGDDDGAGSVDLNAECLSIGSGQPVLWSQIPVISIIPEQNSIDCETTSIAIDASASSPIDVEYIWSTSDGQIVGSPDEVDIEVSTAGTYVLTIVNGACTRVDSVTIQSTEELPEADAGEDQTLSCAMPVVTLDGSGSEFGSDIEYFWLSPDGDTLGDELMISVDQPGEFTLVVRNTTTSCQSQDRLLVTADTASPMIVIDEVGSLNCTDSETEIRAESSESGDGFTVQWTTQEGIILSDPSQLNVRVGSTGTYTIEIINESNGCRSVREVEVVELENDLQGLDLSLMEVSCFGENDGSIVIADVNGGAAPLEFSIDGGQTYSESTVFSNLDAGVYQVMVRDALGCTLTENAVITEPDLLTVTALDELAIVVGEEVELTVEFNREANDISEILWSSSGGDQFQCLDSLCQVVMVQPRATSIIRVIVRDINGCEAEASISVQVDNSRDVFVPNIFSPNGDGVNDRLTVYAQSNARRILEFKIYNRWGSLVFHAEDFAPGDLDSGWDGFFKGARLNPGVFLYTAEVLFNDGLVKEVQGDVTLL